MGIARGGRRIMILLNLKKQRQLKLLKKLIWKKKKGLEE